MCKSLFKMSVYHVIGVLTVTMCLSKCVVASANANAERGQCEDITIPMCRDIGYNLTAMPNQFNHYTQDEAGLEVHQFWPLVEILCSPDLKFFLCSLYAPICFEDYHEPVPACRSVCHRAKAGCAPLMAQYGFIWPERMDCEKLPKYGQPGVMCMDSKNGSDPEGIAVTPSPTIKPTPGSPKKTASPSDCREKNGKPCKSSCTCSCIGPPLVALKPDNVWYNRSLSVSGVKECALPCHAWFFKSNKEREFVFNWITAWSSLCCFSTFMTVLTFLIDMDRFKYPERPIVFLSACYFMVSIGYLIRVILGHEAVACDNNMIRYNATGPATCTLVFLLVYFFGMASSIWWVILSLTWFLAAGLKWGNEAIASYSLYFHLAAWLIPTVKSIAVLIMTAVDGDSVAGICYVGNQDVDNLRGFVLAPLVVYLLIGTSFLLGGFVSLFRIRNVIKQQGRTKADKLEKLMIRIGIFSVLYTLPAMAVIACYFYESMMYADWMKQLVCPCEKQVPSPMYSVLMLKYFMALAVGITSGMWIWSGKTLDSYKRFWHRLTGKNIHYQSSSHRTLKQVNYNATSVQSHIGSVQKQAPLSHV